jgi:hypothetical protein
MKKLISLVFAAMLILTTGAVNAQEDWISLFNGKNLNGWFAYGNATWSVQDGVIVGDDAQGHLYSYPQATDFEFKGMFRISGEKTPNSGMYFRAVPPANLNGFPRGYEAQICHNQDAFTGWLWKPGKPTGPATKMITKDNEWFSLRIRAVGPKIQFWVKDELVMTYEDDEYKTGHFAIQMHHAGMKIEAKDLYYRNLD